MRFLPDHFSLEIGEEESERLRRSQEERDQREAEGFVEIHQPASLNPLSAALAKVALI